MSDEYARLPFVPSLKEYLHYKIFKCGLKPAEIARRAGIAPALLYRFVNDQRDLSLGTIDKILPVIDGEIEASIKEAVRRTEETINQQQALVEAITQLRTNEGAVEGAITGLQDAIKFLAVIRDATGYEFREVIGYDVPEANKQGDHLLHDKPEIKGMD